MEEKRENHIFQMLNSCLLADKDDENTHMEWETNQKLQKILIKSLKEHWLIKG